MMNAKYCKGMTHTIKSGDTLFSISRKYHVPLNVLLQANPYVDVYQLQIGDTICVPVRRREPEMMMSPQMPSTMDSVDYGQENMDAIVNPSSETPVVGSNSSGTGEAVVDFEEETSNLGQENGGANMEKPTEMPADDEGDIVVKISEPGGTMKDLLSGTQETPEGFLRKNCLDKIYLLPGIAYHLKK